MRRVGNFYPLLKPHKIWQFFRLTLQICNKPIPSEKNGDNFNSFVSDKKNFFR